MSKVLQIGSGLLDPAGDVGGKSRPAASPANMIGSRDQRRAAYALERAAIRTGIWGDWERIELPYGGPGDGWLRKVRYVYRNQLYAVLCRPVATKSGEVIHCAIRTASNLEPPWRDKQRIKDECFGPDRLAVEVMPTRANLIDAADMYHMWILPAGAAFDFGLAGEERSS